MKVRVAILTASVAILVGCDGKKEVTVTETRSLTTKDGTPKLFATSDERFRDTKPSPVQAATPDGWLVQPATAFRALNYRFGESGAGEVWVSLSSGTVLNNVNRWLEQFKASPLDPAALAKLPVVPLAGASAVQVTAQGDYNGGGGAAVKPGFALAGVIASVKGQILTVKMVGPKAEVEAAQPALSEYIKSVRMAE